MPRHALGGPQAASLRASKPRSADLGGAAVACKPRSWARGGLKMLQGRRRRGLWRCRTGAGLGVARVRPGTGRTAMSRRLTLITDLFTPSLLTPLHAGVSAEGSDPWPPATVRRLGSPVRWGPTRQLGPVAAPRNVVLLRRATEGRAGFTNCGNRGRVAGRFGGVGARVLELGTLAVTLFGADIWNPGSSAN